MQTTAELDKTAQLIEQKSAFVAKLVDSVESVVIGQHAMVEGLLIGLLTNGHVLLEGVPGLAKTLTVSSLSAAIHGKFQRIQFTPDLLPADLIGTLIYNPREGNFTPRKGPIFCNIVLADEINRAPAKVQSALLEAMQERQVTIGDTTYPLDDPFLVLATQNPIEHEGTYPLPEAQVDRFMLKLKITYPSKANERLVLDKMATTTKQAVLEPVVTLDDIREARRVADLVFIDDKIRDYIVDIVHATRHPEAFGLGIERFIELGASPRATIALALASKARAFLKQRAFVTPQDVKSVGLDVLRHRIIAGYEAEAEGVTTDDIVGRIFDTVPVP